MSTVDKSIDINVPLRTAYNQWTQFEDFPKFMEGIVEVRQLDDTHLHWSADVAGKHKEWTAEITEQIPDQRIAWRSIDGTPNGGMVDFQSIDVDTTRISVKMDYEPEGVVENVGDVLGVLSRRVEGDLQRFKEFLEARGESTGAWRGSVQQSHTQPRP